MSKRAGSIIYIVVFCAIICTPGIIWFAGWNYDRGFVDNRKPHECPEFDVNHLDSFPIPYEKFFNDHFPYRNTGLFSLNYAEAIYLGKSPEPRFATIGADGWLYPGKIDLRFLTGIDPLTNEEISLIIKELNARSEEAAKLGAEYRLVVIPAKSTLYPEYLPMQYRLSNEELPMERLLKRTESECAVPILYLLDSLNAHKDEDLLYRKTDSHWNDLGAWYAYRSIIHWIYGTHPPQEILPIDWESVISEVQDGNFAAPLGLHGVPEYCETVRKLSFNFKNVQLRAPEGYPCDSSWFSYCHEYEFAYQNTDSTLPGLLVIRQSFSNPQFQSLVANHFGRSTFIWDYWQHKLNKEILAKEKPKYVLCIMPENYLRDFIKYPHAKEKGGTNFLTPKG
jgi:alginate O-acetyltransferase complex protein AlgJ